MRRLVRVGHSGASDAVGQVQDGLDRCLCREGGHARTSVHPADCLLAIAAPGMTDLAGLAVGAGVILFPRLASPARA